MPRPSLWKRHVACPACGASFRATAERGRAVLCPECGEKVVPVGDAAGALKRWAADRTLLIVAALAFLVVVILALWFIGPALKGP